jgi:hypothetical protein
MTRPAPQRVASAQWNSRDPISHRTLRASQRGNDRWNMKRRIAIALIAISSVGVAACGGSSSQSSTSSSATSNAARADNQQVINQASQASDNQAQLGEGKIREILERDLGMNVTEDFNLNHGSPPAQGGDCYVKLGADAVNFEDETSNILHSPDGRDVVFVQSNTATPLVSCLKEVRGALAW